MMCFFCSSLLDPHTLKEYTPHLKVDMCESLLDIPNAYQAVYQAMQKRCVLWGSLTMKVLPPLGDLNAFVLQSFGLGNFSHLFTRGPGTPCPNGDACGYCHFTHTKRRTTLDKRPDRWTDVASRLTSQPKVLITNMSPEKYCGWKMLEDYLPFDMFPIWSRKARSESMNVWKSLVKPCLIQTRFFARLSYHRQIKRSSLSSTRQREFLRALGEGQLISLGAKADV